MKRNSILLLLILLLLTQPIVSTQELPVGDAISGARMSWSPDGTKLALSDQQTVQIIDGSTRQRLHTLPPFEGFVNDIKWSPDGTKLAVATQSEVQIWEQPWRVGDAKRILSIPAPTLNIDLDYGISTLAWNPNSNRNQLLGVTPPSVTVWDTLTGQIVHTFPPDPGELLSAAWNPDGTKVALGEITGIIHVYNFVTDEYEAGARVFDRYAIFSIAWNADGTRIAAGTGSGHIELFVIDNFVTNNATIYTSNQDIVTVAWNPNNHLVASGSVDGHLAVWDTRTTQPLLEIQHDGAIPSVAWSPDGTQLAYTTQQNQVETVPVPNIFPTARIDRSQTIPDHEIHRLNSTIPDIDNSGGETVLLDGSGSSDSDGRIVDYSWQEDGRQIAAGDKPMVDLALGVHSITLVVTDDDGATDSISMTVEVVDPSYIHEVIQLELWDTDTGTYIRDLDATDTINLLQTPHVTLAAVIGEAIAYSVQYEINSTVFHTEYEVAYAPVSFALAGYQKSNEKPWELIPWDVEPGSYTIKATPYIESDGESIAGNSLTVELNVINGGKEAITGFTLVDADADEDIRLLEDGDIITEETITIRVETEPPIVGSVVFGLNEEPRFKVENEAAYALKGDDNGDYHAWLAEPGTYTLTATPYTEADGGGEAGTPLTITFTVAEAGS